MKFRQFNKPQFLKRMGRPFLAQFFERFRDDLGTQGIELPAATLGDDEYFTVLAGLATSPEGLPDSLIEAVYGIEEMSNHEGQERLERAAEQAGLGLVLAEDSTHADIALQMFLAAPELFAEKQSELRLCRLSSFRYFGSRQPVNRARAFAMPAGAVLDLLTRDLDEWFPRHNRGRHTARIEAHQMEDEFWFIVWHGDAFTRTPKVEPRRMEVLHFRPAVDDVVVYCPERDELRINAGTQGERELYRRAFGTRLFGDANYFSEKKAYTLEPLRTDGADALDTDGVPGLRRVVLREFEVAWNNAFREFVIRGAENVFGAAEHRGWTGEVIPSSGRLVRAVFDFHFTGASRSRRVEVRPPNVLRLGRHCDARLVQRWLSERGFRETVNRTTSPPAPHPSAERGTRGGITRVEHVVVP